MGAMKLLVVEDDRETAAYLVKGLGESGYVVDAVADGESALGDVIADAQQNRVYVQRFRCAPGALPCPEMPLAIVSLDEWLASRPSNAFAGQTNPNRLAGRSSSWSLLCSM